MLRRSDILLMKDTRDLDSLEKALRYPDDPQIRQEAASALGDLDALQSVESLINSYLKDPDKNVQNVARDSLELLLGNQAEQAVSVARLNNTDNTPWLEKFSFDDPVKIPPEIEGLMDRHNVSSIEDILLTSRKVDLRKSAAAALAELEAFTSAGNLALSYLRDPSEEVRYAARKALDDLMGKEAENVIAVAKSGLDEAAPLVPDQETEDGDSSSEDADGMEWSDDEIRTLIKLAQQGNDIHLRIRALRTLRDLAINHNIHAVDALASIAILDEDPPLNDFSMQALQEIFGDELQNFLVNFREEHGIGEGVSSYEEDFDSEDEEFEDDDEPVKTKTPKINSYNQPPVIQEEGSGRTFLLLAVLFVIGALIFYILSR